MRARCTFSESWCVRGANACACTAAALYATFGYADCAAVAGSGNSCRGLARPRAFAVLDLHAHILRFRKEIERFEAAFSSDAALFHAAEGDAEVAEEPAVDPDGAGVEVRGDAVGAGEIARPHCRGEAVAGGVGEGDRVRFGVERRDRDDGAEDLFLQDAAVASQSGDDGRLDEVAGTFETTSAGDDRAAFLFGQVDVTHHLLQVRITDQRADIGRRIERIADT